MVKGRIRRYNSWKQKNNLMSLLFSFHFLYAQHVSDINISIIRSLWLFCWITTLVCVLVSMCVGVSLWLGWSGVRVAGWSMLQPATWKPPQPNYTETPTHIETRTQNNVVIQQNSRKLLMMDILMSETCWAHKKWNKNSNDIKLVFCFQLLQWCAVQ